MVIKRVINKFVDNSRADSLSARLRKDRFACFIKVLGVSREHKILDVGGTEEIWLGSGLEDSVTLLNLRHLKKISPFKYVEGDACEMIMFGDREFDVVFSNSVIEHVGSLKRQRKFADEVRRVGKRYWVQTPYKHFPIEPHFVFPLFQYLSPRMQKSVAMRWKYSHLIRNGEDVLDELSRLRLINYKEMRSLFPESHLSIEWFLGLPKSLVARR